VLTERVRQEENGWPDQPGDPRGKRTGHGTGPSHLCLLERKHQVEDAIYDAQPSAMNYQRHDYLKAAPQEGLAGGPQGAERSTASQQPASV